MAVLESFEMLEEEPQTPIHFQMERFLGRCMSWESGSLEGLPGPPSTTHRTEWHHSLLAKGADESTHCQERLLVGGLNPSEKNIDQLG